MAGDRRDDHHDGDGDVVGVMAVVGAGLETLASTPAHPLSEEELCGALLAVEHHRRMLDATATHLLAELDRRNIPDRHHGLSTTGWYARDAQLPGGVARQRLTTAKALRNRFFDLDAALTAGECTIHHASVIIDASNPRIAEAMAAITPELLALIPGRTFTRWRRDIDNIARLLDADGGHRPEADEAANSLTISPVINTERTLRARLVGPWAETVNQTIETVADELFHRHQHDHHATGGELAIPDRTTLRALALVEICRRAAAATGSSGPATDLTVVIPTAAPLPTDLPLPPGYNTWTSPTGDRAEDWAGLGTDPTRALHPHTRPPDLDHLRAHTPDGVPLRHDTTAMLLCDPVITAVVVDTLGRPLDLGRSTRFATRDQRRATAIRDGGCVFPGCVAPVTWCDLHHITRHPDGPTDLDNLANLCRHHHRVTHRPGWTMHTTPDQWFWWHTPNGHTTWSQRHQHQRAGPTPDP